MKYMSIVKNYNLTPPSHSFASAMIISKKLAKVYTVSVDFQTM